VTFGRNTLTHRKFCKCIVQVASQNWDEINNVSNPNDVVKMFLSIVDKHAPLRRMRVPAGSSPWITSELKKRMHNRNILKIKAMQSKDPFDITQHSE